MHPPARMLSRYVGFAVKVSMNVNGVAHKWGKVIKMANIKAD